MTQAPQKLATELRVPLRALWPIATHKLRVWGAVSLMPPLIAAVVTVGIEHGFFLTLWGPQSRIAELLSRPDFNQAWFDTVHAGDRPENQINSSRGTLFLEFHPSTDQQSPNYSRRRFL
jgi:hypothetical protein